MSDFVIPSRPVIPDPTEKDLLPEIRLGDAHSHGGLVVGNDPLMTIAGIGEARMGDAVECDLHGSTIIAPMSSIVLVDGPPVAKQGDKTMCGAELIPSQFFVLTEAGGMKITTDGQGYTPIRIVYPGGNDALYRPAGYGRRSGT
jgi:uncharacterized Zn-binding protein involved in type VI secretion